jgi:hypothetical protein
MLLEHEINHEAAARYWQWREQSERTAKPCYWLAWRGVSCDERHLSAMAEAR